MERLKWWQFGVLVGLGVVTLGTIGNNLKNLFTKKLQLVLDLCF
jgi:hypothetical protein